jgi:hypothetical protein
MLCDQRRGQASTGSAARDAAAYAMWAAARAVPQAAMAPLLGRRDCACAGSDGGH